MRSRALESKTTSACNKMDKQQLRVALKVLDKVRICFLDTKQYIVDLIDKECLKEKYLRIRLIRKNSYGHSYIRWL